jgi:HK97 family phage prohead protease
MKYNHFQMEVKEVSQNDGGDVVIEGFASTPDLDRYRDIVEPKAFEEAIEMYMKNPVILYQHDGNKPVGVATAAKITGKGFWIRASIKDEDTKTKILDGRMRALSIGYIALDSALEHEDGTPFNAEKDSYWDATLVRVIKKLDLVEISIVSTPANGNALFSIAKSVKKFFNDLALKSMSMQTKDVPSNEVNADEAKPAEEVKPEAKPTEEQAAPEAKAETEEQKSEETKEEAAAEGAQTEPTNGHKPPEEDEKGDENAPADSGEAPKGEEPKAESKPEAAEGEKSFTVSASVAKALPELVQAGVLVEAKEAGKGHDLPPQVVEVMRKLCDEVVVQAKLVADLQAKLDAIPAKSVLPVVGQFNQSPSAEGEKKSNTASEGFLSLFNKAQ